MRSILHPRPLVHLLLFRPLVSLLFGANIVGTATLRHLNQYILISNHNSHLDVLLLFQIIPPCRIRSTHPVAALDYFRRPRWLYKLVDFLFAPVWVDRRTGHGETLDKIQNLLNIGDSIILFPEGTRGESPELQSFRSGVGVLVHNNPKIPVVPVYLEGPERAFPKNASFPLPLQNFITILPARRLHGEVHDITEILHDQLSEIIADERSRRQHRPKEQKNPFLVAVIGIDGSGKSTLSRELAQSCTGESCFIGDSLEMYHNGEQAPFQPLISNELRLWLGRKAKQAKQLKLYKVPKISELLLRDHLLVEVTRWYRPEYVFMDGSPLLNIAGWSIIYHEEAFSEQTCVDAIRILSGQFTPKTGDPLFSTFPELFVLCRLQLNHLHIPDTVIFLDVEPVVCIDRITSRGERIQPHENLEKLSKLRKAYRLVCKALEFTGHNVCIIEGGKHSVKELTLQARAYLETQRKC